jgi:glutathione S-transferase
MAYFTVRSHAAPAPTKITFFANSFCPFAQRIWMALEIKSIPYQMVEIMPANLDSYRPPEMLEVNPDGNIPSIRHGNWGVWESNVVLEYLEDLAMGHALMPLGNPQLRAHCRLWTDHINRKILPSFYSLLLTPPPSSDRGGVGVDEMHLDGGDDAQMAAAATQAQHEMLIGTLQRNITALVNASHATGPFFLGNEIGFVDVAFAPWILRLSRVLSYYRNFPRPEVGTRWRQWVDAIEGDERVRRTVSDENSYHGVYRGVGEDGWCAKDAHKPMVEIHYARKIVAQEGFGLGGDVWGRLPEEDAVHNPSGNPSGIPIQSLPMVSAVS